MKKLSEKEIVSLYKHLDIKQQKAVSNYIRNQAGGHLPGIASKKRWGRNQVHRAYGRLIFEYEDIYGHKKALHHIAIELWDRDITNPDDFLGFGKTDLNGNFEIWYDPADAGKTDLPDLELRIFEHNHSFDASGNITLKKKLIYTIAGDDNVTDPEYDFGECRIPYWEYAPATPTPRVLITDEGDPPQSYGPGRSLVMVKTIAPIELIKQKHLLFSRQKNSKLSIDDIQNDYPENLTRRMEKENPGITRSDRFFGDCLLNGMAASIMDKDPKDKDRYWIHYHWNSYEQDGVYAMPTIDIKLKTDNNQLLPVEIMISQRRKGDKRGNAPVTKQTFTPGDGDKWAQAKRIARVSSALHAELDAHLCTTHLNTEQYAIAAYRNIRENPVRFLLFPHIKEVALINHSADKLLLGAEGYITKASGFTGTSINDHIRQVSGTLDWKNWKPRTILNDNHIYARAGHLFWDFLVDYSNWFFETHLEKIIESWDEIRLFSDELVSRSVPAFLCQYLHQNLPDQDDPESWFDWNERMDLGTERISIKGEIKAISPITGRRKPEAEDIENLKQVCRYVIYHATFMHWWSNSRQYAEGGELRYNTLGLRYGEQGIFTDENDDTVLPPPADATMQLWISYMLSNTKFGLIMKNEEKDICPKMIEMLQKRKEAFNTLGVKIEDIPSRTNI